MPGILDRLLLLVLGIILQGTAGGAGESTAVATTLAAVTVSALNGYLRSRPLLLVSLVFYTAAGLLWPALFFFLPLVYYEALALPETKTQPWRFAVLVAGLLLSYGRMPLLTFLFIAALLLVAFVLAWRSAMAEESQVEARRLRDDSEEMSLFYREKNRELTEKQNYEIRLATLDERGRIAREIHDQVGHLLSRSILQIGALQVENRNQKTEKSLAALQKTLTEAMDRIRASVHNLHDHSLDLKTRVEALVQSFTFCPVALNYGIEEEPEKEISYCLLAVIKEGLNNVMRHSNATRVSLSLLEHPALYQLVLQDNGARPATPESPTQEKGLGLRSMAHRAQELGGRLVVDSTAGYRLFISLPKRGVQDARAHR